jgi:hypothetical protein
MQNLNNLLRIQAKFQQGVRPKVRQVDLVERSDSLEDGCVQA